MPSHHVPQVRTSRTHPAPLPQLESMGRRQQYRVEKNVQVSLVRFRVDQQGHDCTIDTLLCTAARGHLVQYRYSHRKGTKDREGNGTVHVAQPRPPAAHAGTRLTMQMPPATYCTRVGATVAIRRRTNAVPIDIPGYPGYVPAY